MRSLTNRANFVLPSIHSGLPSYSLSLRRLTESFMLSSPNPRSNSLAQPLTIDARYAIQANA